MLDILKIILPILTMLLIGRMCGHFGFISPEGIKNVKWLITSIFLPVALFHGIGTGSYSFYTALVFVMMFVVEGILLLGGFGLKRFFDEKRKPYVPFMMTIFEGGMLAYPLYMNLCGSENLAKIAILDIANAVFCFVVLLPIIRVQEDGVQPTAGALIKDAFSSPTFVGTMLGVVVGATGLLNAFLQTPAGEVYKSIESMVAAPLSPLILIVLGYEMSFKADLTKVCAKAVVLRFAMNMVLMIPVYFLIGLMFRGDKLALTAVLIYFIATPSLSIPTFIKKEDGAEFLSNSNSLFIILTLAAYIVIATLLHPYDAATQTVVFST